MTKSHAWVLALALLPACSDETEETSPAKPSPVDAYEPATIEATNIESFAEFSAPQIFATALTGLVVGGISGDVNACPKVTEGESETLIEGGCTDDEGQSWHGTATAGPQGVTYDGFGFTGEDACGEGESGNSSLTLDGVAAMNSSTGETVTFTVELLIDATGPDDETCAPVVTTGAIEYSGAVVSASGSVSSDEPSTWNGSGRVGIDGLGRVDVSTSDELVDEAICASEAASGKTTIRSDTGDEAIIAYDGATDCDPESTATWSLNGADQGELSGVSCSAAPGRRAPNGALAALALLAGVAATRRRRTPRDRPRNA